MATNWGDALLIALRTVLASVSGLPTLVPQNTAAQPLTTAAFVTDRFVSMDSFDRECGPTAWQRTNATYQITIRQPNGQDAFSAMSLAAAINDAFNTACGAGTLKVDGLYPVELLAARVGPSQDEPSWLAVPISLSITFDHP